MAKQYLDWVLGLAFAVLTTVAHVPIAVAQENGVEEILVTVRRVSERLQEVPASVSVLSGDDLRSADVSNMQDIVALTPGISIVTSTAEVGDTQINIRGINGARDAESNIALVVDGVLKTNTAQFNQIQGSLSQVEVLKGPQGAYYGRNAAAGAVVITTEKPGDQFAGDVKGGFAENSTLFGRVNVSGPMGDRAGFVLFGDYYETDGFFENTGINDISRGDTVDRFEGSTIGARVVFNPTDNWEIDTKARFADVNAAGLTFDATFNLPSFASGLGVPQFNEDVNDHNFSFIGNIRPDNDQETFEASIKSSYEFDVVDLTAWLLYSDIDQNFAADSTAASFYRFELEPSCRATVAATLAAGFALPPPQLLLPDPFMSVYGPFGPTTCDGTQYQVREQEDLSAEVRLASNTDHALQWSVGVYYLDIDRRNSVAIANDLGLGVTRNQYNPPGSANPTSLLYDDQFDTNVYAVFAALDFDLNDQWKLSVAGRYDREERDVRSLVPNVTDPVTGANINPGLDSGAITPKSRDFKQFQPKISLAFTPTDNYTLYANWGIGFKAGGFNNQGSNATVNNNFNIPLGSTILVQDDFRKEKSSAYELGVNGRAFESLLTFSAAVFHTDVDDLQFFEFYTGGFGLLRTVTNIDDVQIQGVEGSLNLALTDNFDVYGSANFVDTEIKANASRPNTVGNESPYTAKYTLNLGFQYRQPFANSLELRWRTDWRRTGPTWFHTVQRQDVRTVFDIPFPGLGTANYSNTRRDAFDIVDMRLGIGTDRWAVNAFANNLFDEEWLGEVIPAPEFGGAFVSPGSERLLGIEASFSF